MTIIASIVAAAIVGWLAQVKKGRTGAAWAILTLVLIFAWWLVAGAGGEAARIELAGKHDPAVIEAAETFTRVVLPFLVMLVVVATLPKRRRD